MPLANERLGALHHVLHALVLGDLHWQYAARGSVEVTGTGVVDGSKVDVRSLFRAQGQPEQKPVVSVEPVAGGRFTPHLSCSCGYTKRAAKPGPLCLHLWCALKEVCQRIESRRWQGLGPLRDLVGISAEDEASGWLSDLAKDIERREHHKPEKASRVVDRRLVWIVQLNGPQPLLSALQLATKHGWGKPRVVRDAHDLLSVPLTITDRQLLAREEPTLVRSYAAWAGLVEQGTLLDHDGGELAAATGSAAIELDKDGEGYRFRCTALADTDGWLAFFGDDVVVLQGEAKLKVLAATPAQVAVVERILARPVAIPASLLSAPSTQAVMTRLGVAPPTELDSKEIAPESRPAIFIERTASALTVELQAQPIVGGPFYAIGQGAPLTSVHRDGGWVHCRRDPRAEHDAARALAESLGLPTADRTEYRWQLSAERSLAFVAAMADRGLPAQWKGTPLTVADAGLDHLQLGIRRGRDWLELSGGVSVHGESGAELIALADLLQAFKAHRGWVAVGQDRILRLHDDLKRRLELLAAATDGADEAGPALAPVATAPLIAEALHGLAAVVQDEGWTTLADRLNDASGLDTTLPAGLVAQLRPYQVDGYRWCCRLAHWGAGAVLADDMGLGKTLQAIAVLLRRAPAGPQLVVCPTSVEGNWIDEIARFAPSLRPRLFRGDRELTELKPGDVVLASYQLVARGLGRLAETPWTTLVLDEAQMVKNAAAKRATALTELNAEWKLALTGTPVENHLGELWSIMHLILPGLFGSFEDFRVRFARPIEVEKDQEAAHRLSRRLAPFVLRRTKEQVLTELPPKTEVIRAIEPTPEERQLLAAERLRAIGELESGAGRDAKGSQRIAILAALTRLRQLACAPQLVAPDSGVISSKLGILREIIDELRASGHHVLVFSQFTRLLDLVEAQWKDSGIRWLRLDGSTPALERKTLVKRFQDGEADVFLLSLKAGGTGLNLTNASYVIHLDPWWNPAVEDQASDRAHRMGQQKPVTIYRLVVRDSVEEKILALHAEKRDLVDAVLAGTDRAAGLSEDQLLSLLKDVAA